MKAEDELKKVVDDFRGDGFDVDFVRIPNDLPEEIRWNTLRECLTEFGPPKPKENEVQVLLRISKPEPKKETKSAPTKKKDEVTSADLLGYAKTLFDAKEYELSRRVYEQLYALSESQERAEVLTSIASCLEKEGRTDDAIVTFEEANAYQPRLLNFERWAATLIRSNKDKEAAEILERALRIEGLEQHKKFELHKTCGNCWSRAGEPDFAEDHYVKALRVDPRADDIQSNLGTLYLQAGRIVDATQCFEDAIASNQWNAKAIFGKGLCYLTRKEKKKAFSCLKESLELHLNQPSAIFYLVKTAYELKEYKEAEIIVSKFVDAAPVNANLLYSLAGLQFHLGKKELCRKTLKKTLQVQSDHEGAKALQARIQDESSIGKDASWKKQDQSSESLMVESKKKEATPSPLEKT